MKLKGSDKDVATISRELNVQYVLEGSVRKAGNALRITAQLIDATEDAHLWADRYAGNMDDVFEIQERLSREIVGQLRVSLNPEEDQRIAQRPINDLVAYDCYLRAKRELTRWTEEAVDRAVVLLEKGLAIEGPNELLFATLGTAHLTYWAAALPLRQDEALLETAYSYAEKVFGLNPDSPHGYALRGQVLFLKGELEEASTHLKKAHRLAPNNADALFYLPAVAMWGGHPDTARSYYEKLSAVEPWSGMNPAWIDFYSARFDVSVEGYRKEYEVDPTSPYSRMAYALNLAWAGRFDEGCRIFEKVVRDTPDTMYGVFADAVSKGLRGDTEGALQAITPKFLAVAKPHWQMRWMTASLYAMIGRDDEALDLLELAVTRGFYNYIFLEREPFLKRLHDNPRFQAILAEARRRSEAFEP
jgi:tetratricopeptide (TPR) repeat protein